jgi:hypothetical protein
VAHKPVFAPVQSFNLELLARLDVVLSADSRRQNNLALAGNAGGHAS